jgi:DNA-directed RNA polymerase II subunit RPB9
MLYPKEDPDTHRLQFACRTCQYSEEATSSCVFRNVLNNAVGETAGVTQDVGSDPTVGLSLCLLCGSIVACEGAGENTATEERKERENVTVGEVY